MSIIRIVKVERSINWGAKDPKTGKIKSLYDNCKDVIIPGLDKRTGVLRTGLDREAETQFEKDLGLEEGELSKSSPYWLTYKIEIPEDGLTLDTQNVRENLDYHVLKADPTVAKSFAEMKTSAVAQYVMTTENAEAQVKNNKRNEIAKAYAAFAKLSQAGTIDALYMFGKDPSTLDFEVAQNRLGELLDENPRKFLAIVGDKQFKDKVFLMKLISAGVVKKHGTGTGTNMPLYFEDIMLGTGLEEAIAFIKDKANQQILIGIKKTYESIVNK
jgi:hypothetical protein